MTQRTTYNVDIVLEANTSSSVTQVLNQTSSEMSELAQETLQLANQTEQLTSANRQAERGIDRLSNSTREQREETRRAEKEMQEAQKTVNEFHSKLKNLGKIGLGALVAGATALATSLGLAAKATSEMNETLGDLQASTGLTGKELETMQQSAKKLYQEGLGEDLNDVTAAMERVRQVTNQSGKELEKTTEFALAYRDTFGEDVAESIKAADTMAKNFGITTEEAFNLFSQGAQNGLNKSNELLDSANEYAPHFNALGMTAEQMFDMFGSGLDAGAFNLDKIGDAVKEFNIRGKDGSDATAEAYKALGLNATKTSKKLASGGEGAAEAFQEVLSKVAAIKDPLKQNAVGVALFGTMFEDLEADVITALSNTNKQFDATKDTMQEVSNIKYGSTIDDINSIGRTLKGSLLDQFNQKLMPTIDEFVDKIQTNMPAIQGFISDAFDKAGVAVEKVSDTFKWCKDNADELIIAGSGLLTAFGAFKVISGITTLMTAFKTATGGATLAQYALSTAMKISPIGWIATALGLAVAAGVALYKNWDTVKEKAIEFGTSVKETFQGIGDFIGGLWDGLTSGTKGFINSMIGGINKLISGANSISFDVPDWVPAIGGQSFGLNIPEIPMLAKGGVTNGPTLAMIGEGKEQEAVLPLSKLDNLLSHNTTNNSTTNQNNGGNLTFNYHAAPGDKEEDYQKFKQFILDVMKEQQLNNKRVNLGRG